MAMTDPIADMLTRLRNANTAYHETVAMPSSSVKARIAEILQKEGYIAGYKVTDNQEGFGKTLVIDLKYGSNRERSIAGLRRVSAGTSRICKVDWTSKSSWWTWRCDHLDLSRALD